MLKAWFLCLMLLAPNLWAMSLKPEQTQIRVSTESFQAMSDASIRMALETLLVDLTAQKTWLSALDVQLELDSAASYVTSHKIDYSTQPPSVDYQFDPSVIARLIETQGLFVWPKPRPTLLVWGINPVERRFQTWESMNLDELQGLQKNLGLNITSPLLDLSEQQMTREALLWAGEFRPVLQHAQTYSADYIVLAEGADQDWRLTLYQGYERIWSGKHWRELGDFIYQQAREAAFQQTTLSLELKKIQSWADYQALIKRLESNPRWIETDIRQLSPDSVRLDLTVRGSRMDWLRQSLSQSGWVWQNPDQPLAQRLIFAWDSK